MKTKHFLFPAIALALALIVAACNNDGDSGGSGRLTVKMTDAPFPTDLISEANITISKIEIRQAGGTGEGSPFVVVMEEEVSANLLDLRNGVTENLASLEIPAGTYDLVRIYIASANVVLNDGTSYNLTIPSGAQSGLKVFVKPGIEVAGGLTSELLLDFDLANSFKAKGNTNSPSGITGFNFTPVIKASNESFAGRLKGAVTTTVEDEAVAVGGATVSVYAADTLNTTTITSEDGTFTVLGLQAGMYDVQVEATGYVTASADDVEIVAANATTKNFTLEPEQ